MKRTFEIEIEWPDEHGPMWMNVDNLRRCLNSNEYIGWEVAIKVTDVTEPVT